MVDADAYHARLAANRYDGNAEGVADAMQLPRKARLNSTQRTCNLFRLFAAVAAVAALLGAALPAEAQSPASYEGAVFAPCAAGSDCALTPSGPAANVPAASGAPTPYHVTAFAQCPGQLNCLVTFPTVHPSSRFNVQFISCVIKSADATAFNTRLYLQTNAEGEIVGLPLASGSFPEWQFDGTNDYSTISQPVMFSVAGGQALHIFAWPSEYPSDNVYEYIEEIDCTASGELVAAASPPLYHASAHARCPNGINCAVTFPEVPPSSRLTVRFAACEIISASGARVQTTRFYLETMQNGKSVALSLAGDATAGESFDGTYFYSAISQPAVFSVPGEQKLKIFAWPTRFASIDEMDCTIEGQMEPENSPAIYQTAAYAQCPNGINCVVTFPTVPAGGQFNVQFAACEIRSAQAGGGAAVATTRLYLQTMQNGNPVALYLASGVTSEYNIDQADTYIYSALSQPVVFSVSAGQALSIFAWPYENSYIDEIDCTVSGEMVPAAASKASYQTTAFAECPTGINCLVTFPAVSAGNQFNVQFAACQIRSASGASVASTRLYLQTNQNENTVALSLAGGADHNGDTYDGTYTYSEVSQPVVFSVPGGQALSIFAWPTHNQYIDEIDCTVAGQMMPSASSGLYQASASAQCPTGLNCAVSFPDVPASNTLNVQFASCEIRSANYPNTAFVYNSTIDLQTTQDGKTIALGLAVAGDYGYQTDGTNYYSALSQPVVFYVPGGQTPQIFAWPNQNAYIDEMDCTITGQMLP